MNAIKKVMKIILVKYVLKKGHKGDVIDVLGGYGRFLINNGFAVKYSPEVFDKYKMNVHDEGDKLIKSKLISETLNGKDISFDRNASQIGVLFGSVTIRDIIEKIKDKYSITLDKDNIVSFFSLKHVGVSNLNLDILGHKAVMKISVARTIEEADNMLKMEVKI
jgi:large subunit ribosomal protein L9